MAKFVSFQSKAADIGEIYAQMFGRDVTFQPLSFTHKILEKQYIVATFKDEKEQVVGAITFDIPLCAAFAMAFTEMPPDSVPILAKNNRFTSELWENLHEIFNISCRIFSLRKERQIRLSQLFQHSQLPAALKRLLRDSKGDAFSVDVSEYGQGECMIAQIEKPTACFPSCQPILHEDFQEPEPESPKKPAAKSPSRTPASSKPAPKKSKDAGTASSTMIIIVVGIVVAAIAFFFLQSQ